MAPFKVRDEEHTKFNATRIQEALIITIVGAMLAAGASTFTLSLLLEERTSAMNAKMDVHFTVENQHRKRLERKMDKLFNDLYTPAHSNKNDGG